VDWGPGAGEVYQEFSKKMDALEDIDAMRYQLGMRVCESSVRLATDVACGRGSKTVDQEDIEWALKLGQRSFDAACSDYRKYVKDYYEFPVFCRKIYETLLLGRMSDYELARKFRSNQRQGHEYERALAQLQKEKLIRRATWRDGERGPAKDGWEAIRDGN
jgi:DNA replicative helicase MCM subunit Mcm2 (Cdc46/Mcm family)